MPEEVVSYPQIQNTLAIIKPDAYPQRKEIKQHILQSGFNIVQQKEIQLSIENVSEFYREHAAKSFFETLCNFMTR